MHPPGAEEKGHEYMHGYERMSTYLLQHLSVEPGEYYPAMSYGRHLAMLLGLVSTLTRFWTMSAYSVPLALEPPLVEDPS